MDQEIETKTYKTRILTGLFCTFIIMSIVYIPLAYRTKFGVVDQTKDWDIQSTIKDNISVNGSASEKYKPYVIGNTIYFGVILKQPGDYITYEIELNNKGKLDSRLDQFLVNVGNENNPKNVIKYTVTGFKQNDILKAGETKYMTIKVEWDPAITENIFSANSSLVVNLQFVQN